MAGNDSGISGLMHVLRGGVPGPTVFMFRCVATCMLVSQVGCFGTKTIEPIRKPVFPFRGKVLIEGRPISNALVKFHSLDDPSRDLPPSAARTSKDGSFELSTYAALDGAPEGEYAVTVSLVGGEDEDNKLPGKYARAETSGLRATVNPGNNESLVIRLSK